MEQYPDELFKYKIYSIEIVNMVTLRTEAGAVSPISSSSSSSDSLPLTKDMPSTSRSSLVLPAGKDKLKNGSRMLSKQSWEELKPTIRQLYLNENRTLKQLAEYIHELHGVKPT
jgi:hypothetical protein